MHKRQRPTGHKLVGFCLHSFVNRTRLTVGRNVSDLKIW
jgi:hypothetical protein